MAEHVTDPLIDKADALTITDKLGEMYAGMQSALETATTGCQALAEDILGQVMAVTDPDEYYVAADLLTPAKTLGNGLATDSVAQGLFQAFVQSLDTHCQTRAPQANPAIASITSLDTFATYWNGAGVFSDVLFSPDFAALYAAVKTTAISRQNVYSPEIKQGETYANAMGKFVVDTATFTDGAAVAATRGCAMPKLKVTEQVTKSGVDDIVITVTGVDHAGTAAQEWTYTSAAAIDAGDYDFAEVATRWLRDVTGIVVTGAGAGTFYVEGWKPTGRP